MSGVQSTVEIIFAGDSGVGKSSLLAWIVGDDKQTPKETIGMEFVQDSVLIDGKQIHLNIWDTSGQERFQSLCPQYFRKAKGVILVYDITQKETFDHLLMWYKNIRDYGPEGAAVIIVGNKIDKHDDRVITRKEGLQFATQKNSLFMESTATVAGGIHYILEKLVRKVLKEHVSHGRPDVLQLSEHSYDVAVAAKRGVIEKCC
ncbi:ras-related protein Rab-18-B-like [Hetaerina americana]|uniref:ras-related protein Rab-18-B-like n=1 Tax=Hetaerina americana TaxID=62018 RepID=UPI003A7F19E4